MKKLFTLVPLLLMAAPFLLFAGTTGKLTGTVTDKTTGEPLPFVNIILEGTNLGAASDIDGKYVILNIPPGRYSVKIQYIGYQTYVVEGVGISIDLTTRLDAELSEVSLELQTVVVQATADVLKKDITSSQATVSASDIENLPVAEMNDVLQLQAGITRDAGGGFHVRGGRSSEISYKVNGISVTDAYDNSRGIEIDNSSIQEVQVISGTFNAEHGDALSGIINAVTKEGGQKYTGQVKVYSSDYVSNFTDYFTNIDDINPVANYNFQGSSLGGPIPFTSNKLSFFANARYNYDDGYLYGLRKFSTTGDTLDGKAVAMNWGKRIIGQANVSYSASSAFKFNLEGLYSAEDYQDYDHFYKWNPDGNLNRFSDSFTGTITMTHTVASSAFYTVKASLFNHKYKHYLYESETDPRYIHGDSLQTVGYAFADEGTNLGRFSRETNTQLYKFDFTSQVSENHLVKFGAESKIHDMNFDDFSLIPKKINGVEVEPFEPAVPGITDLSREKYEANPFEVAAYLQDKIEYESVIINIGLRLDYFDSKGKVLVDPTDPNILVPLRAPSEFGLTLPNNQWTQEAIDDRTNRESSFYQDAESQMTFSPRFGVAYPISAGGVVHFSYGQFVQIPSYRFLFDRASYKIPESGTTGSVFGNPGLKPQRTLMYEIGFRQELFSDFLLDITSFYRDIRDWVSSSPARLTRNGVIYYQYINKDYANVKGITLNFKKQFSNYWQFDVNYTFQVAEGLNSSPEDEFNSQRSGSEPALYLLPLDWDQNHILNLSFYFGGEDWGASLIGRYGTGLPYTPSITQFVSDRGITSGLQRNSRRRPAQFIVDLRLHKSFDILGYELTGFVQVFNILDAKVVTNVFGDTGKADFTTEINGIPDDPNRPNTLEEWFRYPDHYAPPRLVQFGFEITF